MPKRLLMLDRDGTLNQTLGRRPPNRPAELVLLPNVRETILRYIDDSWLPVLITNQAGVAFGHINEEELAALHQHLQALLGFRFSAIYTCLQHPRARLARYRSDPPCRKPRPGMLLQALDDFDADARDCLMVGDMDADREAASAAGIPFRWAADFFGWSP